MTTLDRIKDLRKQSWISQEEMAKLLNMSRLTYRSIENWTRDIRNEELKKIAQIFETSVQDLIIEEWVSHKHSTIASDHPQYKMIQTVLYILTQTAWKPNIGKVALNKLLYFSDFNHYEKYWESISWDTYIKMPMGPVPKSIDGILALMEKYWYITSVEWHYHGYTQYRFMPMVSADMTIFSATEKQEIDTVIKLYWDKNGKRMTEFSHGDIPYRATKNVGDEISYGLAGYREGIYSVSES